jgi:uncharacterized protein (DUF697 family)/CRP-like cAMP-binding protein
MNLVNADMSTILDRILDKASDNLRIAKILVQLGLDPNNVTYDAIFSRLLEIFLASITLANMCALIGAAFYVATLLTRTMVPLRLSNMTSNVFFIAFGALASDIKTFLLYLLLLPINAIRLYQMLNLVKKARNAVQGDTSMEWLKPFMSQRKYRQGDVLFKKGDAANEMFLTVTGKFLVTEIGVELPPGRMMGELGFLTPNNRRTATVECTEAGQVLSIAYDKLLEIYFQNPQFGYYFLVLTSQRLLQNIARLEGIIAAAPKTAAQAADLPEPLSQPEAAPPQQTSGSAAPAEDASIVALATTAPAKPQDASTATTRKSGSVKPEHASTVAMQTASPGAAAAPPDDRRASAMKLVERFSVWSGVAGIIPVPFVDLAAVGGVQIQMLRRISKIYGVPFSENRGKSLIASLAGSMIPASSGMGVASALKSVPVVGTAVSGILMPAFSAGATYAIGMAFIQHFASGGTLLDFKPSDYRELIKAQKARWSARSKAARAAKKSARAARPKPAPRS